MVECSENLILHDISHLIKKILSKLEKVKNIVEKWETKMDTRKKVMEKIGKINKHNSKIILLVLIILVKLKLTEGALPNC